MAQTPDKYEYPTGQDPFQPHRDIKKLAESITGIVPVDNREEADAIASAYQPSPGKPLIVSRADTGNLERTDGTEWQLVLSGGLVTVTTQGIGTSTLPNNTWHDLGPVRLAANSAHGGRFIYRQSDGRTLGQGIEAITEGVFQIDAVARIAENERFRMRTVIDGSPKKEIFTTAAGASWRSGTIMMTARLTPGQRLGVQMMQDSGSSSERIGGDTYLTMTYLGQ